MALNCLENVVGIDRLCSEETSLSGLYINDLPEVSLRNADATVDDEYENGIAMLRAKINQAVAIIRSEFMARVANVTRMFLLENKQVGEYLRNQELVPSESGYKKGYLLEGPESPNAEIYIDSILVSISGTSSHNVEFYDTVTGELLLTKSVVANNNKAVKVVIQKAFKGIGSRTRIAIVISSSGTDASKVSLYPEGAYPSESLNGCAGNCTMNDYGQIAYFRFVKIDSNAHPIFENFETTNQSHGLVVNFSIRCSIDNILCGLADQLGLAIQYKAGALVMAEMVSSTRLNYVIIGKKTDWAESAAKYDALYMQALNDVLKGVNINDPICIKCKPRATWITSLP